MHICLPDTREVKPQHGSAYLLYNVHIDGLYHCSLRFKQLLHLHQALSKKFTGPYHQLPQFPPKKLLPLSGAQVEERRMQLEKYLQNISQDKAICNSSIFNLFFLEAQRESTRIRENQVHLDIELVNGQKIRLQIVSHDSADAVLTSVCRALGLNDRYHAYFCLCLCGYDVVRDKLIIKRRLSFFESPFITLQMAIQQQEQLQTVLANNFSPPPLPQTTTINDNNNINNNNNNISNCRCQSCSTQQSSSSSSYKNSYNNSINSTTTGVPLVGSSSGSYVISNDCHYNNNQSSNNHHHQYNQYQPLSGNNQISNGSSSLINGNRYNHQAPTTTTTSSFVTHRILLRKSYWDPIYDTYILNDQQALNLLFIQTVYDIKHSLMFVDRETYHKLESLLATDSKLEYILLARTLKYYNYVHFEPCFSDYPKPRTKVMISIGSKELNMRVLNSPKTLTSSPTSSSISLSATTTTIAPTQLDASSTPIIHQSAQSTSQPLATNNSLNQPVAGDQVLYCTSSLVPSGYQHLITKEDLVKEEHSFKVPLIRCWRLTSLETLNSNSPGGCQQQTAPEKRKSLSLFGSVLSANSNSCSSSNGSRQLIASGTGGLSLLATLNGQSDHHSNNNSESAEAFKRFCQQQQQRNWATSGARCCQGGPMGQLSQYELSFEYLMSKDTLKWVTISSDQAIFISISLQGVVDELVSKRDGRPSGADQAAMTQQQQPLTQSLQNFTYLYRDGSQKPMNTSNQQLIDKFGTTLGYSPTNSYALALARQRQQQVRATNYLSSSASGSSLSRLTSLAGLCPDSRHHQATTTATAACSFEISSFKKAPSPIINDAFEGVTNDDDL